MPTKQRQIDSFVLRKFDYEGTGGLSAELIAEIERTRESIPPTLRGKALDAFIKNWIDGHLNTKLADVYGGFLTDRFRQGKHAIPMAILQALELKKDHVFGTDAEMRRWLEAQGWPGEFCDRIAAAVPPTIRGAEDMILCLDLANGNTIWKATVPGEPRGRIASATPAIVGGKIFAIGSARVWCVRAADGKAIWDVPLHTTRPVGSSPLVMDGRVFINADGVVALEADSGKEIWRQKNAGKTNSSPRGWKTNGRALILVNGKKEIEALDAATGDLLWSVPGGGASTPVISRGILVAQTKSDLGLVAWRLSEDGAEKIWNHPIEAIRRESSPLIYRGSVYLLDHKMHACFDLATGRERWRQPAQSEISSPVCADGKLWVMANQGNSMLLLQATPNRRIELGKATVRAAWAPSPCITDGRLILRLDDRLKSWSLLP